MRGGSVEAQNTVREGSKFINKNTGEEYIKCTRRSIKYLAETTKRGLFMKPRETWDGEIDYEFNIDGWSAYGRATDLHTRKGFCDHVEELNRILAVIKFGRVKK